MEISREFLVHTTCINDITAIALMSHPKIKYFYLVSKSLDPKMPIQLEYLFVKPELITEVVDYSCSPLNNMMHLLIHYDNPNSPDK